MIKTFGTMILGVLAVHATVLFTSAHDKHAAVHQTTDARTTNPSPTRKPNVMIILVDDLGFSDVGCYGSEIQTPNLDKLASNGLRFTNFYNTGRCWPTRAAVLTGYYAQQVRRDAMPGKDGSGGRSENRPTWARLLPNMLRPAGYRSYHSGKWHVDGKPLAEGFDHSYYVEDLNRYFSPQELYEDDKQLPAVKPDSGYYITTAIADHTIAQLKEHEQHHSDKPFFQYVAFNAPHFPLHALPEDIARYKNRYEKGWDVVRQERWERIQKLGIVEGKLSETERNVGLGNKRSLEILGPDEVNRPIVWEKLTAKEKAFQITKMSIHAAMVDRMDREIGRILEQLRAMKALDDTLIMFLSDNGASAEILVRGDGHDPAADPGSAKSHLCLGAGWSTCCNTPFRRHKIWVHEGGTHTPLIVHWPNGIISAKNELRRNVGHVIDIVPTILEATKVQRLEKWNDIEIPPAPGKSLASTFTKDNSVTHDSIWWYHSKNRALRVGDWKIVAAKDEEPWELYNMKDDPTETNNLASKKPNKVKEMDATWKQQIADFEKLLKEKRSQVPKGKSESHQH